MKIKTISILTVTFLAPLVAFGQENPAPTGNIHLAALQGDVGTVRQYIEAEGDLNVKDPYGSTPLLVAAAFGTTEVALALIEAGADLNATNNVGGTALHTAAFFCRTEIVEALLDNGADADVRDNDGNTAYDAVAAPFDAVVSFYDDFQQALGPLGLVLDYEFIRNTRPAIAEMLRPRP
jgi:ankyrin repeat protein